MTNRRRNAWRRRWRDHLASPEWAELRWRVLARAKGRCERCDRPTRRFHVHHRTYAHLGHEALHELEALCPSCHAREHGKA